MATFNSLIELSDQLCYVQCNFCNTILLVSVPCKSLLEAVTVSCGHCEGLLSVNMGRASFVPLELFTSFDDDVDGCSLNQNHEICNNIAPPKAPDGLMGSLTPTLSGTEEEIVEDDEEDVPISVVVNKPPEKRQRAPSAYNHFIKEEIKRIKDRDPNVSHKEAFSSAAKNWAHFPRIQQKGSGHEGYNIGRSISWRS